MLAESRSLFVVLLAVSLLTGCAVGPHYKPPDHSAVPGEGLGSVCPSEPP